MKKVLNANLFLLGIITLLFSSCLKDECSETRRFLEFRALYAHPDQFRIDPLTTDAREMEETGKIYIQNDMILINEKYEGLHVIDNTDPAAPNNIAFIEIPGNIDVSIRDNILFADSYVDLLTIDISDIQNPILLCRDEDLFQFNGYDEQRGYLIDWIPEDRILEVECSDPNFGSQFIENGGGIFWNEDVLTNGGGVPTAGGGDNSNDGQGGSFARFSLVNDYLYVIDRFDLTAYDITNPSKPIRTETVNVGWNIETLFPYKEYLFIGSETGLFIFDLVNPSAPRFVSEFSHARACDPVFVKDDVAFVTLRNGTRCQNFINQLDVLDVSDPRNPELIRSYEMDHPHGLSVVDNTLYLCEGSFGLKSFDVSDLNAIADNQLDHVEDFDAYDAISLSEEHLLVIGADGLYQFNTTDPGDITELSFLAVAN